MAKKGEAEPQVDEPRFIPRYPAIEKLIDSEDFDAINKNFGTAYEGLEKLAKQKGLGSASDARKAMLALEKAMDLMAYLLKLKYQYLEAQGKGNKEGDKSRQKKSGGGKQLHQSGAR